MPLDLSSGSGKDIDEQHCRNIRLEVSQWEILRPLAADYQHLDRLAYMLSEVVAIAGRLLVIDVFECMTGTFKLNQQILSIEVFTKEEVRSFGGELTYVSVAEIVFHLALQRLVRAE